jgi:hypothetical protein
VLAFKSADGGILTIRGLPSGRYRLTSDSSGTAARDVYVSDTLQYRAQPYATVTLTEL